MVGMESDRNIFVLGIVLIFLAVGSYVMQLHMEIRKARAERAVHFCEYTLTHGVPVKNRVIHSLPVKLEIVR